MSKLCDRLRRAGAEKLYVGIESGSKDNRSQFKAMMQSMREGRVQKIIVTRFNANDEIYKLRSGESVTLESVE